MFDKKNFLVLVVLSFYQGLSVWYLTIFVKTNEHWSFYNRLMFSPTHAFILANVASQVLDLRIYKGIRNWLL